MHTDLPNSDFEALFEMLENDPASYLRGDPAAFASAVGRSFYQQILPSESVTLGWTSWAVQWLSRTPGPMPDQVQVAYSKDAAARAAYSRQAAEDWRAFLVHRGRELRPGGRLVVLTMAIDDNSDFGYGPAQPCPAGLHQFGRRRNGWRFRRSDGAAPTLWRRLRAMVASAVSL